MEAGGFGRPEAAGAGSPNDSAILKLQQSADGQEYIVVRENLDVERINATSGARKKIGALPEPKKTPGRTYELHETKIADDGLIIRDFSIASTDKPISYYQAFDSGTGRVLEGELTGIGSILRKSPGGGLYAIDNEDHIVEIKPGKDGLVVQKPKLSKRDSVYARHGGCVAGMTDAVKAPVLKELNDQSTSPGAYFKCRKIASNYLIEEISSGSSGEIRSDVLFRSNGKKIDLRDILKSASSEVISYNNFAWVGAFPTTQALATRLKAEWVGVLLNRSAYVLKRDTEDNGSSDDGRENWSVLLHYRHPTFVESARFIGPDRLVAVEAESGRLVAHDFGKEPKENFFTTSMDSIIGSETPVGTLLHQGTCVGYAIPRTRTAIMPDGRKITFNTSSMTEAADKHELDISGLKDMVVALGDDADCIQFSADWKRLLTVKASGVTMYDFQNVLQTGTLAGNEIRTLPTGHASSAFFVDPAGERIITSNYTNHVLLWSEEPQRKTWLSTEIYKGDNLIYYAEPDATAGRLILIEKIGGGEVRGLLYSLGAREVWFDLGSDYKWLGAAFAEKSNVVVSEHFTWARVFPMLPLSAFAALADKQLSPGCRPPSQKDYRQSPCWPASYR